MNLNSEYEVESMTTQELNRLGSQTGLPLEFFRAILKEVIKRRYNYTLKDALRKAQKRVGLIDEREIVIEMIYDSYSSNQYEIDSSWENAMVELVQDALKVDLFTAIILVENAKIILEQDIRSTRMSPSEKEERIEKLENLN